METLSEKLNGYTEWYTKNISEARALELNPFFSKLGDMIELAFNQERGTTDFDKSKAAKPGALKKMLMDLAAKLAKQMNKEDVFIKIDLSKF